MDESVKYRIIGGVVLAIMALSLIPILIHLPPASVDSDYTSNIEPLTPENKMVDYEERWQEPAPVASVDLDKEHENIAAEAVEAQPILKNVKFTQNTTKPEPDKTPVTPVAEIKPVVKPQAKHVSSKPKVVTKPKVASKPKVATKAKILSKPKITKHIRTAAKKIQHKKIHHPKIKASEAWVVQLGTFSNTKNAKNLRDRLRKKGYTAYLRRAEKNGKTLQRLYVGPEVNHKRALVLSSNLTKETHIKGMVVHYTPRHR